MANITLSHANIELRSYESTSHSHSHNFSQWVLPLTGELELEITNQAGLVNSHQAAFIANQEHHCYAGNKSENAFLVLDITSNNTWMNHMVLPRFWDLPPALAQFLNFSKCYLNQQNNDLTSITMIKDFLMKLLSQHFLTEYDKKVLVASSWIDTHFASTIDVSTVANHCCLSSSQLQRRFKRALGQGIAEYWRMTRLQHAQHLLTTQKIAIEAIAHSVGYENLAAFSRSFVSAFGVTPSQWRNMQLAAKNLRLNAKATLAR